MPDDSDEMPTPKAESADDFLDEVLTAIFAGHEVLDEDHPDYFVGRARTNPEMLGCSFFAPEAPAEAEAEPAEEPPPPAPDAPPPPDGSPS